MRLDSVHTLTKMAVLVSDNLCEIMETNACACFTSSSNLGPFYMPNDYIMRQLKLTFITAELIVRVSVHV